ATPAGAHGVVGEVVLGRAEAAMNHAQPGAVSLGLQCPGDDAVEPRTIVGLRIVGVGSALPRIDQPARRYDLQHLAANDAVPVADRPRLEGEAPAHDRLE